MKLILNRDESLWMEIISKVMAGILASPVGQPPPIKRSWEWQCSEGHSQILPWNQIPEKCDKCVSEGWFKKVSEHKATE